MGRALSSRLAKVSQLCFYDHTAGKSEAFEQEGFGKSVQTLNEAVQSDIVILAVKPQNLQEIAEKMHLKKGQVLVSILAGTSLTVLKDHFNEAVIIRMMPSLAVAYGAGVIGMCSDESQEVKDSISKTFESLGELYWLPETKINALTSLTGSGPAFFYSLIESMIDAGIAMGFTAKEARKLVLPMLQGSLILLENSGLHPADLKWQITSPQGTTIAGLKKLEESAVRAGLMNTFLAAYDRANELSK